MLADAPVGKKAEVESAAKGGNARVKKQRSGEAEYLGDRTAEDAAGDEAAIERAVEEAEGPRHSVACDGAKEVAELSREEKG